MLTKVTKHSKETNSSTIRFCRALDNSKQDVTTLWGVCPYLTPFYLMVMDCWKYCKGYKFALSVACPRARKLSTSGKGASPPDPWPGALPLDRTPLGALPPDPRYRLALHALAMCPPPKLPMPPCSSTPAMALVCTLHGTENSSKQ